MRISRKRRYAPVDTAPVYRFNDHIRVPRVRVIGFNGEHLGDITLEEAVALARREGHDLVEINPKSNPPICKIVDYGQFKYQKDKEERLKKQKQKAIEVKGIRISARIGGHDTAIRIQQSLRFLKRGDKVKIEMILRGREQAHRELAEGVMHDFIKTLGESADLIVEQEVKRQGNKITALIAGTVKANVVVEDKDDDEDEDTGTDEEANENP